VNRYYGPVVKRCTTIVGDPSEAEDLAQEVFTDAYTGIAHFRGEAKFSTWLFQIAQNKAFRRLGELKRRSLVFDPGLDPLEETDATGQLHYQVLGDQEASSVLRDLVEGLRPVFKAAIKLRLMGYKHEEIADMMHCPVATVRTRVHRAVEMMREEAGSCDV
jgi:RNA polymerase sigma-70 factor (ECF subfamily)